MGRVRIPIVAYLIAAAVIAADQASKYWVLNVLKLAPYDHVDVAPPAFRLTLLWNRGVSFSLFRSPDGQETIRWILAAFAAAVSIALMTWAWRAKRMWSAVGIGFIIGGALGNLIDRVRFGAVADFMDFSGMHFPWIFNVADSGINIGVAVLLIETFFTADKDKTAL